MKRIVAILLSAVLLLSMLTACTSTSSNEPAEPAPAEPAETSAEPAAPAETPTEPEEPKRTEAITLRWGATGAANATSTQYITAEYVMDYVTKETGGMIQFEYYPSQQLGGESSMFDQVMSDTLDLATIQPTTLSAVWSDFMVMSFPFAYPTVETYWRVFNNDEMYDYWESVMNGAAHYIGIVNCAYRGLQNTKHEIRSAADFKGLTFRIQAGAINKAVFESLGASTATLETSELFTALQQGVVDGEDNIPSYVVSNSYYEVDKFSTELNAITSCAQLIMAPATWDKLLPSERQIFRDALHAVEELQVKFVNENNDECYAKMAENGMTVTRAADLTDAERQTFVDAISHIWDEYSSKIDPDFYAKWQSALD